YVLKVSDNVYNLTLESITRPASAKTMCRWTISYPGENRTRLAVQSGSLSCRRADVVMERQARLERRAMEGIRACTGATDLCRVLRAFARRLLRTASRRWRRR